MSEKQEIQADYRAIAAGLKAGVFDLDDVTDACERDDHEGICVGCGEMRDNCEPDARRYPCEACGQALVFGAQEILLHIVA